VRKGVFSRIFNVYALVLVLGLLVALVYVTHVVRETRIEELAQTLRMHASLAASLEPFGPEADRERLVRMVHEKTGARLSIIAPDGTILADSDRGVRGRKVLTDPELKEALFAGSGYAVRTSLDGQEALFSALRVEEAGRTLGFIRLSVPLREVNASVNRLRMKLLIAFALVFLVTGGVSIVQTGRLQRLVRDVTRFTRALARGNLERRLTLKEGGDFGEIAENLNTMAGRLRETIAQGKEEYERLNVILRSIPDALLIVSPEDDIVMSSAASRNFFGVSPVAQRPLAEVVRSPEFFAMLDRVRRSRATEDLEFTLDYPEEKYVTVKVSPLLYDEEEPPGLVAIFHDITQIKKLEQVRKDFVANLSHELKTPIASIKGFADTLLMGALEDEENARKFLGIISSNSERINTLVDDLMTISKIELGVIKVQKRPVDLGDVLEHVLENLAGRAKDKGLSLAQSVAEGARQVRADRDRLIQILTNLVDNAIKFTDRGGVTVRAGLAGDGRPFIAVEDTGIGVAPQHIRRLGERFYRVDPSRSRKLGGTGLGLAIVKHLVKAHGWEMAFRSQVGHGTTVTVLLRAEDATA
jgi:two-component system phosphate regulon sensor histidine kinase PhoR